MSTFAERLQERSLDRIRNAGGLVFAAENAALEDEISRLREKNDLAAAFNQKKKLKEMEGDTAIRVQEAANKGRLDLANAEREATTAAQLVKDANEARSLAQATGTPIPDDHDDTDPVKVNLLKTISLEAQRQKKAQDDLKIAADFKTQQDMNKLVAETDGVRADADALVGGAFKIEPRREKETELEYSSRVREAARLAQTTDANLRRLNGGRGLKDLGLTPQQGSDQFYNQVRESYPRIEQQIEGEIARLAEKTKIDPAIIRTVLGQLESSEPTQELSFDKDGEELDIPEDNKAKFAAASKIIGDLIDSQSQRAALLKEIAAENIKGLIAEKSFLNKYLTSAERNQLRSGVTQAAANTQQPANAADSTTTEQPDTLVPGMRNEVVELLLNSKDKATFDRALAARVRNPEQQDAIIALREQREASRRDTPEKTLVADQNDVVSYINQGADVSDLQAVNPLTSNRPDQGPIDTIMNINRPEGIVRRNFEIFQEEAQPFVDEVKNDALTAVERAQSFPESERDEIYRSIISRFLIDLRTKANSAEMNLGGDLVEMITHFGGGLRDLGPKDFVDFTPEGKKALDELMSSIDQAKAKSGTPAPQQTAVATNGLTSDSVN